MMNWFERGDGEGKGEGRITIASDWAPVWTYQEMMERDPLAVYGDVLPVLQGGDLNIVNVECVLGTRGEPLPKAGPCLQGSIKAIASLTEVPFHLATLSNNHSMDYGPESLEETLEVLRTAGLDTVGAGMDGAEAAKPWIGTVAGARIGVINCGEAEACASFFNGPGACVYDSVKLSRQIGTLKKSCDIVIVIFHGGREHAPVPPPFMVTILRQIAEAGADAVVAHHPHVPQGMEIYRGVPIAYSQGNFVFRKGEPNYFLNTGYLVHLDITGRAISGVSITPYQMTERGLLQLREVKEAEFLHYLRLTSALLDEPEALEEAWDGFVDEFFGSGDRVLQQLERGIAISREKGLSGLARLHHYFFCPAHQQLFASSFARLTRGRFGDSPEWARRLALEIRSQRVGEPLPSRDSIR